MPGPNSTPQARGSYGIVAGKTKLKAAKLKSGEGMNYANPIAKKKDAK